MDPLKIQFHDFHQNMFVSWSSLQDLDQVLDKVVSQVLILDHVLDPVPALDLVLESIFISEFHQALAWELVRYSNALFHLLLYLF